jgi:MFS family permease
LGAALGPLAAAGLLLLWPGQIRRVFWVAAIPGLLAVAVIVLFLREVGPADPPGVGRGAAPGLAPGPASEPGIDPPARAPEPWTPSRSFKVYLAALAVFTLGNASDAFILLLASDHGVGAAAIPLLWGVHNLSRMVWNVVGGRLADRFDPRTLLLAGWGVYAATYAGFAAASAGWHIWGLMVVYGLFYGLTEAPEKALVARMAPAAARGRAFGAFHFVLGLGALPASVIFGVLWEWQGPEAAFLLGAGLAGLAALVLLNVKGDAAPQATPPARA